MLAVRQCSANRERVAGKLVGDHHPRLGALSVKHPMQETLGGYLIAGWETDSETDITRGLSPIPAQVHNSPGAAG
jgi:hypothetical protein